MIEIKKNAELLPGWRLNFSEVSNGVYQVSLTDHQGRIAGTTDGDLNTAIQTCESYAFDIEKQISRSWGKFLYETCLLKLDATQLDIHEYNDSAFGSWYFQRNDVMLVYDARDQWLILRKSGKDKQTLELPNIAYESLIQMIELFSTEKEQ